MLVISQKIIKMINSSTKSHRYDQNLICGTPDLQPRDYRVKYYQMERILYNTCFLHDGRYLTFNENKSFQRLGSHYDFSEFHRPTATLRCKNHQGLTLLLVIKVTLLKKLFIILVRKDFERSQQTECSAKNIYPLKYLILRIKRGAS